MRIAKYIANAGLCSRREAEKLIDQKKVFINGSCCDHPSIKVTLDDEIIVNKKKNKIRYDNSIMENVQASQNYLYK